ncbi:hypothetical protein [Levilactobacillus bambusae]|uniref:DUF3168 domain-containing protein n=1 Tax=Levilactobacillus bambusae TaxID=2024736 RepID=A0A2V1N141_9LACO|nr:hypothetical protein [Levilactobacillus bambusae]PWG00957.1 hypothetical protein DCM90_01915 [Levilactobacillus bambusae]
MVYNVNVDVNRILKSISALRSVRSAYPDEITVFPMAVYQTRRSTYVRTGDNVETDTNWQIVIDIFIQEGSLTFIVDEVTDKFAQIGFEATVQQANQAGFNRAIITLIGVVDNTNNHVYQAH